MSHTGKVAQVGYCNSKSMVSAVAIKQFTASTIHFYNGGPTKRRIREPIKRRCIVNTLGGKEKKPSPNTITSKCSSVLFLSFGKHYLLRKSRVLKQ